MERKRKTFGSKREGWTRKKKEKKKGNKTLGEIETHTKKKKKTPNIQNQATDFVLEVFTIRLQVQCYSAA